MESKQLTRKLNTIFWWTLSVLPLLIILVYFIMGIVNLNTQGTSLSGTDLQTYFNATNLTDLINSNLLWRFNLYIPSWLSTPIDSLFTTFGVNETELYILVFGWFIMVEMVHLLIDVLLFVIRWVHDLLERGGKRC